MGKKHKSANKKNNKMMKALKAINSISDRTINEKQLKRHRKVMERLGRLAAPKGEVDVRTFNVGGILCEEIKPKKGCNLEHAILYAHGGGYICGGIGYARILAAKMAAATGLTTYSFEYRLAPEHPYPAALEDGINVWEFLIENMYDPDRILFAGDSAGGNLVLCMTQRLMSQKRTVPEGLLLLSPWTDMTGTTPSYDTNKDIDPILTKDYVMDASKAYISGAGGADDYRFSPLYGELKGLPPVYIMAGRNEILLDDSVHLKDRIEQAGGRAILDIEENGWHVYQQMPVQIAELAMKRLAEYVSSEISEK